MEQKTQVTAEDGKQDIRITRIFDLPVAILFTAFVQADLVEQWMGTKVLKLESKKHGAYQIETTDANGHVAFRASGVIHELVPNRKIIRTFEMENTPFGVQLEVYDFEILTATTSKLTMHVIYETVAQRDQLLKWPFTKGINLAHNRLQDMLKPLKSI